MRNFTIMTRHGTLNIQADFLELEGANKVTFAADKKLVAVVVLAEGDIVYETEIKPQRPIGR